MQVLFDQQKIYLSPKTVQGLMDYMIGFINDMREQDSASKDCWTWGMCTITDLANHYPEFEYGGDEDYPRLVEPNQIYVHI